MKAEAENQKPETLEVGNFVKVPGRGEHNFMVLRINGDLLTVRQWPLTDAPPAFEVSRSTVSEVHE